MEKKAYHGHPHGYIKGQSNSNDSTFYLAHPNRPEDLIDHIEDPYNYQDHK